MPIDNSISLLFVFAKPVASLVQRGSTWRVPVLEFLRVCSRKEWSPGGMAAGPALGPLPSSPFVWGSFPTWRRFFVRPNRVPGQVGFEAVNFCELRPVSGHCQGQAEDPENRSCLIRSSSAVPAGHTVVAGAAAALPRAGGAPLGLVSGLAVMRLN